VSREARGTARSGRRAAESSAASSSGRIVLVATPIGNLEDLSARALRTLASADVVACEDTRHSGQMLARSGIRARRLLSLHAHNEAERGPYLVGLALLGETVAVISDAGMPTVSDPGRALVAEAVAAGVTVSVVPGPSASVTAIALSGFRAERWHHEGFLPRKGQERAIRLAEIAASSVPSVLYESPGRVAATIGDLGEACGPTRRVVVARELTKAFEEVWRGSIAEFATRADATERGEYVLVVDGAPPAPRRERGEIEAELVARLADGASRRAAVDAVAIVCGLSRREVYEVSLGLG